MRLIVNDALEGSVTEDDHRLMVMVWQTLNKMSEVASQAPEKYKFSLNCHSISRALALHLKTLKVVTGFFLGLDLLTDRDEKRVHVRNCVHSWLVTRDGAIIDPYPVGVISHCPLLIGTGGPYRVFGATQYYVDPMGASVTLSRKTHRETLVLLSIISKISST